MTPKDAESTLLIIKPDGVRRALIGEVLRRVEEAGLTIDALRMETIDRATAEEQYGEHRDKPFFAELVDFITSVPVGVATENVVHGSDSPESAARELKLFFGE